MNFDENDFWSNKRELLKLRLSKLSSAKVLLKLEFDTKDQVLLFSCFIQIYTTQNMKYFYQITVKLSDFQIVLRYIFQVRGGAFTTYMVGWVVGTLESNAKLN